MPTTRLLLVLLGTLLLLADGIALQHAQPFPHPASALVLGLIIGQVGLVASWAATSRQSWLLRVALVWACAALAAWPLSQCSGPSWRAWAGLLLIYAVVVVAGWKLLLAAGYTWSSVDNAARGGTSRLKANQYSLAWMLKTTTALALALGIGSWLALPEIEPWLAVASMAILALFMPLVISTLLLQTPRWWLRGALVLVVPLGAATFLLMNRGAMPMILTLLLGVETLVALLAATVLASTGIALVPITESTASGVRLPSVRLADAP